MCGWGREILYDSDDYDYDSDYDFFVVTFDLVTSGHMPDYIPHTLPDFTASLVSSVKPVSAPLASQASSPAAPPAVQYFEAWRFLFTRRSSGAWA